MLFNYSLSIHGNVSLRSTCINSILKHNQILNINVHLLVFFLRYSYFTNVWEIRLLNWSMIQLEYFAVLCLYSHLIKGIILMCSYIQHVDIYSLLMLVRFLFCSSVYVHLSVYTSTFSYI